LANTYKILGAVTGGSTPTVLYTVGSGKSAVLSSISACNNTGGAITINVQVQIGGSGQFFYLLPNASLSAGTRIGVTEGWTLNAGDVIRVGGNGADFVLFGSEIA
jgi:hypothetical protein